MPPVYVVDGTDVIEYDSPSLVPQGETYFTTREEALQNIVDSNALPKGWMYSNKPVADYVYYDEDGVVYFLYDISATLGTGEKIYLEYKATGLSRNDYNRRWSPDSLGNERTGPAISNRPPNDGDVYNYDPDGIDGELTRPLSITNLNLGALPQGFDLGEYINETMGQLSQDYPWLFEKVNDKFPGLTIFLQAVSAGVAITEEQLKQSGLDAGYTSIGIDYLNATISSMDDASVDKVMINGVEQTNRKYASLESKVSTRVDTELDNLGFNADVFKRENMELYADIVAVLMRGTYADYDQFEDFLGYFLGVSGYELSKGGTFYNDFTNLSNEIKNATQFTPHIDLDSYKSSALGKATLIDYIGIGAYNALDSKERARLINLYGRDSDAATAEFQRLFDNDTRFERFSGKGLRYSQIAGQYKQNYLNIYGEVADETSSIFLDSLGMSYTDAKKFYREDAYAKGNPKFMRDIGTTLQASLGGPVIR